MTLSAQAGLNEQLCHDQEMIHGRNGDDDLGAVRGLAVAVPLGGMMWAGIIGAALAVF